MKNLTPVNPAFESKILVNHMGQGMHSPVLLRHLQKISKKNEMKVVDLNSAAAKVQRK